LQKDNLVSFRFASTGILNGFSGFAIFRVFRIRHRRFNQIQYQQPVGRNTASLETFRNLIRLFNWQSDAHRINAQPAFVKF